MEDKQRQCLRDQLLTLSTELDLRRVLLFLQSKGILKDHHIEEIKVGTVTDQRVELVKVLQQRGPHAFNQLYHALIYADQNHLALPLKSFLSSEEAPMPSNEAGNRSSPLGRSRSPSPEAPYEPPYQPQPIPAGASGQRPPPIGAGGDAPGAENGAAGNIDDQSIEFANKFYKPYQIELETVTETQGLLHDLSVEYTDGNTVTTFFDPSHMYRNFTEPRGLVLIINNRKFGMTMPERFGTDVDATNLVNLFRQLRYSVKRKDNLSAREIRKTMVRFSLKTEHKTYDSAIVIVLTHGVHGQLYGSDGNLVPVDELVNYLNASNCPELKGKPKLFFLQACRGEAYDPGKDKPDGGMKNGEPEVEVTDPLTLLHQVQDKDFADALVMKEKIPTGADILTAYATTPGYVSWRNSAKGSWFVQSICKVFAQYAAQEDLGSMLTRVNRMVASSFQSSDGAYKQIPEPCSRLTKQFYFFPSLTLPNQ